MWAWVDRDAPIWVWVESISAWWWNRGLTVLDTGDIVGKNFWNECSGLLKEVGTFTEEV